MFSAVPAAVETLLELKRGELPEKREMPRAPEEDKKPTKPAAALKRFRDDTAASAPRPSWKPSNTEGSRSSVMPAAAMATFDSASDSPAWGKHSRRKDVPAGGMPFWPRT